MKTSDHWILRSIAAWIAGVTVSTLACALVMRAMSGEFRWGLAGALGVSIGGSVMVALGCGRQRSASAVD